MNHDNGNFNACSVPDQRNGWVLLRKGRLKMNSLKVGATIKCRDKEDMVEIMLELAKEGVETDILWEKDGVRGLWLEVTEVREEY